MLSLLASRRRARLRHSSAQGALLSGKDVDVLLPAPVGMSGKKECCNLQGSTCCWVPNPLGCQSIFLAHGRVVGFIRSKGDVLRIFLHFKSEQV